MTLLERNRSWKVSVQFNSIEFQEFNRAVYYKCLGRDMVVVFDVRTSLFQLVNCSITYTNSQIQKTLFNLIFMLSMANSLYEMWLQRIMGVVFDKTYRNAEYNYHDSLRACLVGGIKHSVIVY